MLTTFLSFQLTGAVLSLIVGLAILIIVRLKTKSKAAEEKPAGFWARLTCLGVDFALIEILTVFTAYYGSMNISGYISVLLTFAYFFFFWIFFSSTPAKMLVRMKIAGSDGGQMNIKQTLLRLAGYLVLAVGWITILFNRKNKKALHDFIAGTRVIYSDKPNSEMEKKTKIMLLILTGIVLVCFGSLIFCGLGEKISNYPPGGQANFFDLDKDGINDGLTLDTDKDGVFETVKYDLNNDGVVEMTAYDSDLDGVAETLDLNNDGRIDAFDFNNDSKIDKKLAGGYVFIWLTRIWFILLGLAFAAVLTIAVLMEKKKGGLAWYNGRKL